MMLHYKYSSWIWNMCLLVCILWYIAIYDSSIHLPRTFPSPWTVRLERKVLLFLDIFSSRICSCGISNSTVKNAKKKKISICNVTSLKVCVFFRPINCLRRPEAFFSCLFFLLNDIVLQNFRKYWIPCCAKKQWNDWWPLSIS